MLLTERHRWVPWAALVPTLAFATAAQWLVATSSRPLLFLVLVPTITSS